MGVVENVKEIATLIQKIDNVDLYRKILDLQAQVMNLEEENAKLRTDNSDLRDRLEVKGSLVFNKDCYWLPRADNGPDGPFCSNCWDTRTQLVRMIRCGNPAFSECPTCKRPIQLGPWEPPRVRRPTSGY
jgi:hypothetical protein